MGSNEGLCWRCGEIEPHGMDCGCLIEPCFGLHPDHIADATEKGQPAPAPLLGDDGVMCARLLFACTGHPHALIPWPHRLLHDAVAHISDLTRRLAEAEAERDNAAYLLMRAAPLTIKANARAEAAEARVREMEATIDAMAEAHAHDDQALTAAYLSGAHAGKKQAEAERDALRERCGRLERVRRIAASIRFTETYRRFPLAATDAEYAELDAALAATEVKP